MYDSMQTQPGDDDPIPVPAHWQQDITWLPDGGWTKGEFDQIAPISDNDLSLVLANWSAACGCGQVPKPATLGLIVAAVRVMLRPRRKLR